MLTSGFGGAPVSRALLFGLLVSTIATTATDSRHLFPLRLVQDLWMQKRWWKLFIWQVRSPLPSKRLENRVLIRL